jgi:hypothetical protein
MFALSRHTTETGQPFGMPGFALSVFSRQRPLRPLTYPGSLSGPVGSYGPADFNIGPAVLIGSAGPDLKASAAISVGVPAPPEPRCSAAVINPVTRVAPAGPTGISRRHRSCRPILVPSDVDDGGASFPRKGMDAS